MAHFQLKLVSHLVLLALSVLVTNAADWNWGYGPDNGPAVWPENYPDCGGDSNSPIDILESTTEPKALGSFEFTGLGTPPEGAIMTLSNNGHTATVSLSDSGYLVSGGGLPTEFKAAQFHFHWGNTSAVGSEHLLNSMSYPGELHLVTFNHQKYADLGAAVTESDGLAVLGAFLEIGTEDNPAFEPVISALSNVTYKDTTYELPEAFAILPMYPDNVDEYYRYQGGLTSPGCYETVVWTVMKNPVQISEQQLQQFRLIKENAEGADADAPMEQNFRPPRALNQRTVYINDATAGDAISVRPVFALMVISVILAVLS